MTFPIYGKIRVLFQTTNQMISSIYPIFCSIASRWAHHWRHGLYEILWIEAPTGWNHLTERNTKGTNEWSEIIAPQVPTVGPDFQVSVTKRETITWPMIFVWNPPSSPSLLKSPGLPVFFSKFSQGELLNSELKLWAHLWLSQFTIPSDFATLQMGNPMRLKPLTSERCWDWRQAPNHIRHIVGVDL